MGANDSEGETAETVAELFATDGPPARRNDPLGSLSRADKTDALDSLDAVDSIQPGGTDGRRPEERKIALWTMATVSLALVASLLLGVISISGNVLVGAFGAGILTGGSGLFLGFAVLRETTV